MTIKEYTALLQTRLLDLYNKEEAKSMASMLLNHFCAFPSHLLYAAPEHVIPQDQLAVLLHALDELLQARPIQYIIGETEFEGCIIKVKEGVLIPRPETAELVRWAVDVLQKRFVVQATDDNHHKPALRILDLCTGSGAIAIALAKAFPAAEVCGVDISPEALVIARRNAQINSVDVHFMELDVLDLPAGVKSFQKFDNHQFDLIISNPPYVCESEKAQMRPNVLKYEPHTALFVPDSDPLIFYRAILQWGLVFLKERGVLMAEINQKMNLLLQCLIIEYGFTDIAFKTDLCHRPRTFIARRPPII